MKRIVESSEFGNLNVYGELPSHDEAEREQVKRVLHLLNKQYNLIGPWNVIFVNKNYKHQKGSIIEKDKDWCGQYDLIVLSEHKIIIYELKGFQTHLIEATTSQKKWVMKNSNQDRIVKRNSYFTQASKQRIAFLKDVLESLTEQGMNHWDVDSRVIFKDGSHLVNFWYFPTATIDEESFQTEYLSNISNEKDSRLLQEYFSKEEKGTGKKMLRPLRSNEVSDLRRIFRENQLNIRTTKWFKVLTERQIVEDLKTTKSSRFLLNYETAEEIMKRLTA